MSIWSEVNIEPYLWNPLEETLPVIIPESVEATKLRLKKSLLKTNGPIDKKELGMRQTHAESGFKTNARNSNSGAAGVQLIIPKFAPKGYTELDLYDPAKATQVRNKMMQGFDNYPLVTLGMPSDSVLYARKLAAYNWGAGNLNKALKKAVNRGIDINDGWDWISLLPRETLNYINFILRGLNTGSGRNEEAYLKALITNRNTANVVRQNIM